MKKVMLAFLLGVVALVLVAKQPYGISYVMTNSIAKGYYFSTKTNQNYKPQVGEIVCVDFQAPAWVIERQYLPKDLSLCKKVAAVEGEFIRQSGAEVEVSSDGVNWVRLAKVQPYDSKGRKIEGFHWGESTQLKNGEFFAFGDNNVMSLDSRYLGPLKTESIRKTLTELYVYRSNSEQ